MHQSIRRLIPLLLALSLAPATGRGEDDDDEAQLPSAPAKAVAVPAGAANTAAAAKLQSSILPAAGGVRLAPEQQRAAGIVLQVLAESRQRPEFAAYARVVDIQPLLNLSTRQRALQAESAVARAALAASQKALERTAKLHSEDAASMRSLQAAQAQQAGDAARAAAAEQQLAILRNEAVQQWGPTLAGWALAKPGAELERLLLRQEVLVELALPAERSLPGGTNAVRLARQGDQRQTVTARLVSAAPRTGEITQGETWFAVAPAATLRTGMRLDAWIAGAAEAAAGVEFPVTAVLWRAGRPWVYVKTGDDSFARRLVPSYHDHGATWFVDDGLAAGEQLVIGGAQLLLSEEFRGQIPAEDDD